MGCVKMVILKKSADIYFLLMNVALYLFVSQTSTFSETKSNQNQINNCTSLKEFQCGNEQCIDKSFVCDGYKQCTDGSDESPKICNPTSNETLKYKRAATNESDDSCPAHSPSEDKNISYECENSRNSQLCYKSGFLPRFTVARMNCRPDYSPLEGAYFRSICHENSWIPELDDCFKKCDKLNPENVDLKCYRRGNNIPCKGNVLLAGTRVRPTCKKLHKYRDFIPTYREIVCQYNGKWDNTLFSCIPECGKPYISAKPLIRGGENATVGDSPWHVAIYNRNKTLLCGGTIIHPFLVISAAHCFHTVTDVRENSNHFEVVVSKFRRDYGKTDHVNQKIFQIREIRYPTKGYTGLNNYYAADIAIVILTEKITISPTVLPACIDWAGLNSNEYPPDGTLGKVVGWGLNEHSRYSETLQVVNLPIINRERCLRTVPDDFKPYITYDKFCAGTDDGPTVLQGDSGGGYLLQENGVYFLRGIVSLKQPTSTATAAFTDLADHIDWILATRNAIEQEIMNKNTAIPQKNVTKEEKICGQNKGVICAPFRDCLVGADLVRTQKAVLCGFDNGNHGAPKVCCPSNEVISTMTSTAPIFTHPPRPATSEPKPPIDLPISTPSNGAESTEPIPIPDVVVTNCDKYSVYAIFDCVNATIPDKGTAKALPKEYPHMARIGYGKNFKDVEWLCDGSLISENFVLTAARCKNKALGEPKWIMLGDLNITSTKEDARPEIYSIVKSHYSCSGSNNTSIYENLALYQLNATVSISSYVRPACLQTSSLSPIEIGTKSVISGWGWGPTSTGANDRSNEHLLKASLTVVDNKRCEKLYDPNNETKLGEELKNGFQSETMICAGDYAESEALCADVDGSPLQIRSEYESCAWKIFAVSSFGPTSCGNAAEFAIANPRIYVNVITYLNWIKGIVWPEL